MIEPPLNNTIEILGFANICSDVVFFLRTLEFEALTNLIKIEVCLYVISWLVFLFQFQ